ncbi:AMP-binding protein [Chloroflexota bacterium]
MRNISTCGQLAASRAATQPDATFYFYNSRRFSYKEVNWAANRVANGLTKLGIAKGHNICLLLGNSMEHIYTWYALMKLSAVIVPVNIQMGAEQVAHIVNNCETSLLIAEPATLPLVEAIVHATPAVKTLVLCGEAPAQPVAGLKTVAFTELLRGNPDEPHVEVAETDLACILYTSGTTGAPKGVMLSHEYFLAGGELYTARLAATSKDVFYTTLPLYHIMGCVLGMLGPLTCGGAALLAEKFSASRYWELARRHGATCASITGTQTNYLFQQPPKPDDGDNPLRLISSFPVPVEIGNEFETRFNVKLGGIYGLTEALLPIMSKYDDLYKMGALGTATDYDVRIADDADNELPPNEAGNLLVRPQQDSRRVFDGYYKMPEATLGMIAHCWFHTGDVGYKDEDGFIWFASRKKDVIRFRGENVSASHVESFIGAHEAVAECAIIGVPAATGEEDIKAVVCLKTGHSMAPDALLDYCANRMSWFMVPRYVEFTDKLPRTATDKIEKFKLKHDWDNSATWDREAEGYQVKK